MEKQFKTQTHMPLQANKNHHSICWLMYSLFNNVNAYCGVHSFGV